MKQVILLDVDENTQKIEEEEKLKFIRSILTQLGLPIEDIWQQEELSVEQGIFLRRISVPVGCV